MPKMQILGRKEQGKIYLKYIRVVIIWLVDAKTNFAINVVQALGKRRSITWKTASAK